MAQDFLGVAKQLQADPAVETTDYLGVRTPLQLQGQRGPIEEASGGGGISAEGFSSGGAAETAPMERALRSEVLADFFDKNLLNYNFAEMDSRGMLDPELKSAYYSALERFNQTQAPFTQTNAPPPEGSAGETEGGIANPGLDLATADPAAAQSLLSGLRTGEFTIPGLNVNVSPLSLLASLIGAPFGNVIGAGLAGAKSSLASTLGTPADAATMAPPSALDLVLALNPNIDINTPQGRLDANNLLGKLTNEQSALNLAGKESTNFGVRPNAPDIGGEGATGGGAPGAPGGPGTTSGEPSGQQGESSNEGGPPGISDSAGGENSI